MNLTPLEQALDEHFGKVGTPKRDHFERDVDEALHAYRIGEAIKAERLKQNLTQEELGKKVGAESLKLTFDAMHGAEKPSTVLGRSAGRTAAGDWKKLGEVPAEELKLMRKDDPEQYRRLYKAEYGIDCPELD